MAFDFRISAAPRFNSKGGNVGLNIQHTTSPFLIIVKKVPRVEIPSIEGGNIGQVFSGYQSLTGVKSKLVDLFSRKQIFGFALLSKDEEQRLNEIPVNIFAESNKKKLERLFDLLLSHRVLTLAGSPSVRATNFDITVAEVQNMVPIGGFKPCIAKVVYSSGDEIFYSDSALRHVEVMLEQLKRRMMIVE